MFLPCTLQIIEQSFKRCGVRLRCSRVWPTGVKIKKKQSWIRFLLYNAETINRILKAREINIMNVSPRDEERFKQLNKLFPKIDMVLNCFIRAWIFFTKVCMIVTKTKYIWTVLNSYNIGWFALVSEYWMVCICFLKKLILCHKLRFY